MMVVNKFHRFQLMVTTLLSTASLFCAAPLMAADSVSGSGWKYGASIYMWGPSMNIDTPPGREIELPFYPILTDLKMTLMFDFSLTNDKWSFMTDVIYMKLRQDNINDPSRPIGEFLDFDSSIQMKSWIVSPTVGYALVNSEKARVEVFGGLRYLWIDLGVQINSRGNPIFDEASSVDFWDGIVGLRANVNLNQQWFMPLSIDVGWGDSDGTWQGIAGVGYRFKKFNTSLTYRYLSWDFDDVPAMSSLVVKGPLLNFNFTF
jgi:hypothetical protein